MSANDDLVAEARPRRVPTAAKLLPLRRNFSSSQSRPVQHKSPADLGEVDFPQNFSAALFRLFGAAPGRATV